MPIYRLPARNADNNKSILYSSVLAALAAVAILLSSISMSISKMDQVETGKAMVTLNNVLTQYGQSLGRELKVQTLWADGYNRTRARDIEWMNEFYGSYLDKLLGYSHLYVIDGSDNPVYAYEGEGLADATKFEQVRAVLADLVGAVRGSNQHGEVLKDRLIEQAFTLGELQSVTHRYVSDIRSIAGRPNVVVVSTIVPDSEQAGAIENPPFLMVAVNPIDQATLDKMGANFGFKSLSWNTSVHHSKSDDIALLEIKGTDGKPVGVLSWKADHPGIDLGKQLLPGLGLAFVQLLAIAAILIRRTFVQARSLAASTKELAKANETLEHRVRNRTRELQATFDNVAQGVILTNAHGEIVLRNRRAIDLMELDSDGALQEELARLPEYAADVATTEERRHLSPNTVRRDLTRTSGRQVELRQARLADDGAVWTVSDVTALKKRQGELEAATDAANAANQAKSRFLSTMSHEMRTPLNGIIGSLELIARTQMSDEQRHLVKLASKSSEALLVHINDVLDFSKLEADKFELTHEPFDLLRTMKSVRDIVLSQAEHRKNNVVIDVAADVPRCIVGDAVRLRQILLNLVSNANKFTRDGTITVSARSLSMADDKTTVEFAVRDTGAGIPPDRLGCLFKEFSMIESEYKRNGGGTGLGLAISKRFTEAMGGTIGVDSVLGAGSVFTLQIPFPVGDETQLDADPDGEGGKALKPLRVLLVDDNATNRLVGSRLLGSIGHTVETAENGRAAIEAVTTQTYDVVLMDISMPEMDGLQATAEIRKLGGELANLPIIALTANAIIGDREKFIAAGMNDYASKPFRLKDLQDKLAKQTDKRAATAAPLSSKPFAAPESSILPLLDEAEVGEIEANTSADVIGAIIEEYVKELEERRLVLEDVLATRDASRLQPLCHAISGASRSVGASRLAEIARAIEVACIEGDARVADEHSANIGTVLADTLTAFRARAELLPRQAA